MTTKVKEIEEERIKFDNGYELTSFHQEDCCEEHFLSLDELELKDLEGLEFDLSGDDFFKRIEGFGIELIPVNGFPVRIPGYGFNNGHYSDQLDLWLMDSKGNVVKKYNITECQMVKEN